MTEPALPASPSAYQLRVVLRGLSPLVWRRLLVHAESTIADLHLVLQASFGWSDDHLHRFEIHGREYGISYLGGISFPDDARSVGLRTLGLRVGERFVYEYDFGDAWFHDLRVEQIARAEPRTPYPRCIGGRRAGPPENCGGAWGFQRWRQDSRRHEVTSRLLELLTADADERADHACDFEDLCRWIVRDDFDRRRLNRRLAALAGRSAP
ncbi:MAG: plasmid pRiA4b ORF-3 family protein [Acidimicrobiales bacterium]